MAISTILQLSLLFPEVHISYDTSSPRVVEVGGEEGVSGPACVPGADSCGEAGTGTTGVYIAVTLLLLLAVLTLVVIVIIWRR